MYQDQNAFLVLGYAELDLYILLREAWFNSNVAQTQVYIRAAKIFPSNEQYGPEMPRIICNKNRRRGTVDWVGGKNVQIVLNGDNNDGSGLDIFFALECKYGSGYIIILDQRNRLDTEITQSNITSKLPNTPSFFNRDNLGVEIVV